MGACSVIIALRHNYCPIDQTWHKSLLKIISGPLSGIFWRQSGKSSVSLVIN